MTSSIRPKNRASQARLRVRLYIAGNSPNSVVALANLRRALLLCPEDQVALEIIDVVSNPERGVRDGVLVTPMLVSLLPLLERRVLGNLRDRRILLDALDLEEPSRE